jgi:hypothetical protein
MTNSAKRRGTSGQRDLVEQGRHASYERRWPARSCKDLTEVGEKMDITATPGAKMQFLIGRRPEATREELIANWFANHMPDVIASQHRAADKGQPHATRYIATLYNPVPSGEQVWDGIAQLWWDKPLPRATEAHGTEPRDTFQQKAKPYVAWPTTEYVIVDGTLSHVPNTLNDPYPCTRSGFLKVTTLLTARADTNVDDLFAHWLNIHAPNVANVMEQVGGSRYVISHSIEPAIDPYVGMAELYFPNKEALRTYLDIYESDGIEQFIDHEAQLSFRSTTEMVGIP